MYREQQENSAEESEGDLPLTKSPSNPTGGRKPTKLAMQNAAVTEEVTEDGALRRTNPGRRIGPIRESRGSKIDQRKRARRIAA